MANQQSKSVADFVLSTLSKNYLDALEILAKLKFPLADRESFLEQINTASGESKEARKAVAAQLSQALGNLEFPIETPRSAMEKFHSKTIRGDIGVTRFPFPLRLQEPFDPRPVGRPEIDVRAEYIRRFGIECGLQAYDVYLGIASRRRTGADPDGTEVAAYWAGLRQGDRCLLTKG